MSRSSSLLSFVILLSSACSQSDAADPAERPSDVADAGDQEPAEHAQCTEPASMPGLEPPIAGEPGLGWSLRDELPYPRSGHSAVLDTDRDRMLVFGGGANDVWALELSGEHEGHWSQIEVSGELPPVHRYGTGALPSTSDAAIYVPERHSMIVVLNAMPTVTAPVERSEVWELSLAHTPTWQRLSVLEAPDGIQIQSARAVYDACGQRLLALGGEGTHSGLWALGLSAGTDPTWTRLADAPIRDGETPFYDGHSLLLDAARNRVLLMGGVPRRPELWALDLNQRRWQMIDAGNFATESYGASVALDSERDQLVIVGGDQQSGYATYALQDQLWSFEEVAPHGFDAASVVVDAKRDRLILFGGGESPGGNSVNETWTLALGSGEWAQLGDASETAVGAMDQRMFVYDPTRDEVIAFGGYSSAKTYGHPLATAAPQARPWTTISAGTTPQVSFGTAIYNPIGKAIVSFGGYDFRESSEVWRLRSDEEATWELLEVTGPGPLERSGHVMVYDAQNKRAIVFGGSRDTSYPPTEDFDDVWALSLEGELAWTELKPGGTGPSAGQGSLAIYDPVDQQMLVLQNGTLWALSLGADPQWSRPYAVGTLPDAVSSGAAVYDPDAHRMLLFRHEETGTEVYALRLEMMSWRKLCPDTITPAPYLELPRTSNAVLVPDGVFMAFDGATYRFDLSTPTCD